MANPLQLDIFGIVDTFVRRNFERVQELIDRLNARYKADSQFAGFEHFDVEFSEAVTNKKLDHGIGEIPLDLVETFKTGAGTITYNYDSFDASTIDVTTTDACRVRFYLGVHKEGLPL